MPDLSQLWKRIEQIPQLSATAGRLLRLHSSRESSLAEIGKAVSVDPGLTAAVLRSANSAAARPAQPISSVVQAVSYLGEQMVLAMALAACVPGGMVMPLEGYRGHRGALWRHSLSVALCARELAKLSRPATAPDLAFTAGLLHDIGKPVLGLVLGSDTTALLETMVARHRADSARAEHELVGVNHAEVGEALARRWNLPEALCFALRHHHDPAQAPPAHRPLAGVVHLSDLVTLRADDAIQPDELAQVVEKADLAGFRPSPAEVDRLLAFARKEMANAMATLEEAA
jgi:putative nucleotidyltransferase with HDIG domain